MKILIGSPYMMDMRGNSITAKRMIYSLQARSVDVIGLDYYDTQEVIFHDERIFTYDVLHILNPVRYLSSLAYAKGMHAKVPYGITFTGTDINCHLDRNHSELVTLLTEASFITVFHEQSRQVLLHTLPELAGRVTIVAQSFFQFNPDLTKSAESIRHAESSEVPETAGIVQQGSDMLTLIDSYKEAGYTVVILPAGIRKVKRVPWAIEMFNRFTASHAHKVFLCIVGPEIEQQEARRVEQLVQTTNNIAYFREMDHQSVLEAVAAADVLLNCSESEGQSLAIIEAFQLRTPVIASNVPGNAQMIRHGENGLLFDDESGFRQSLITVIQDKQSIKRLIQNAYEEVQNRYNAEKEIKCLMQLYENVERGVANNGEIGCSGNDRSVEKAIP